MGRDDGTEAGTDEADRRRAEIVAGAAVLFDRYGYHSTNMQQVAETVGLQKPSIYHYFSSKEEILFSIHSEFIEDLIEGLETAMSEESDPTVLLRKVINDIVTLVANRPAHPRVFFDHYRELSPDMRDLINVRRDLYFSHVKSLISRGMEDREFREQDAQLATMAVFGICNWTYQWYRADGPVPPSVLTDYLFSFVTKGLM